jgi:hypothetical protein
MSPRPTAIRRALATASAITAIAPMMLFISATSASATTTSDIASLALANTGKGAGWCSQSNSSNNSLGGNAFGSSCDNSSGTGNGEYWCADFAKWVWQNANGGTINTSGLTPGAGSFYTYGSNNGTLHTSSSYVPQAGDAVVYDYQGSGVADHVGLVTAVNSDGSVQTANGDWGGSSGVSQAYFAETSSVVTVTLAPSERSVGSVPSGIGMTISGYITPVGLTSGSTRHDLYQKHSDGSIWKYTGTPLSGWTQVGNNSATKQIAASNGGGALYELDTTGTIWQYANSAWTKIDNNTAAVQIASNSSTVYQLHGNGSIWKYTGTPLSGWTQIGNNAAAVKIAASESGVYELDNTGTIWQYANSAWTKIDNNTGTVGVTATDQANGVYELHSNGSIWKYTGTPLSGWTQIGTNAAAVFVDAIPGGGVVELDNTGTIWEYVNSAWTKIDNNAATTAVQVGDDGAIYEFHNDGSIWVYDGVPISGWTELDNNAAATGMAAGDSRAVHK